MSNVRRPKEGTAHHLDPERSGNFGSTPRVGQAAKPYVSGSNAHGVHQNRTRAPAPGSSSGHSRAAGPRKGWDGK